MPTVLEMLDVAIGANDIIYIHIPNLAGLRDGLIHMFIPCLQTDQTVPFRIFRRKVILGYFGDGSLTWVFHLKSFWDVQLSRE